MVGNLCYKETKKLIFLFVFVILAFSFLQLKKANSINDITPPIYSLNSTNSTLAGAQVEHRLYWEDDTALSHAILSFDNCTGTFQNISIISFKSLGNFNQTSSINITGNASTTIQSEIDKRLNINGDGLTWDVTEQKTVTKNYPVLNQNFTSSATGWTYGEVDASGVATGLWEATGGHYDPGVYHMRHDDTSATLNPTSEQWINYTFSVDSLPTSARVYAFYRLVTDDSTNYHSEVRLILPNRTEYILYTSPTITAAGDTGWVEVNVDASSYFTQTGNYTLKLYVKTNAAPKNSNKPTNDAYWDDVGVELTYVSYELSVEHNATISYSGLLRSINVSINFTSTANDIYNMSIYNFITSSWDASQCQSQVVIANSYYTLWCNITVSPTDYVSPTGTIRVRLNTTPNTNQGTLKEEYIQYYIEYNPSKAWSNFTVITNSAVGCTIRWCVYANDTSNNWNGTSCENPFSYVTTSEGYLEVALIIPPSSSITFVDQNSTFNVNATVTCRNGYCGNVYGTVRYNATSFYPDTPISEASGDKPFYVVLDRATKACPNNPLSDGDFCNITWIINATGDVGSEWKIGVLFNSSSVAESNHTDNATIKIIECHEGLHFGWDIDFGILNPNTFGSSNPAPGNAKKLYNITNTGTCVLHVWIKGTDIVNTTLPTSNVIGIGNLTWNIVDDYSTSFKMTKSYSLVSSNFVPGANITMYYWLTVPPVYAGLYRGNITICGNTTQVTISGGVCE